MTDPRTTRQIMLWIEKFTDPDDASKIWWHWQIYRGDDVYTTLDVSSAWYRLRRDARDAGLIALQAWQLAEEKMLDVLYDYMTESKTDIETMTDVLKSLVEDMQDRRKS